MLPTIPVLLSLQKGATCIFSEFRSFYFSLRWKHTKLNKEKGRKVFWTYTEIKNGSFRVWLEFWMNDHLNFCLIRTILPTIFFNSAWPKFWLLTSKSVLRWCADTIFIGRRGICKTWFCTGSQWQHTNSTVNGQVLAM